MSRGRPALFLDRDGVINVDHGYVYTRERFDLVDGIFDLARGATRLGYVLVVVTNQAGIGRGFYTEDDFRQLTNWMRARFHAEGAPIAGVYHCPFHPEYGVGPYKVESPLRKPAPGMLLQAAADHAIDLRSSVLIGDRDSDIGAAQAAGLACALLYRPATQQHGDDSGANPTATIARLTDALPYLHRHAAELAT